MVQAAEKYRKLAMLEYYNKNNEKYYYLTESASGNCCGIKCWEKRTNQLAGCLTILKFGSDIQIKKIQSYIEGIGIGTLLVWHTLGYFHEASNIIVSMPAWSASAFYMSLGFPDCKNNFSIRQSRSIIYKTTAKAYIRKWSSTNIFPFRHPFGLM